MVMQKGTPIPITFFGNFVVIKDTGSDFGDLNDEEVNEAKFIYQNTTGDETIFI